jgi:N-dimethylarginine dimethylaminohydrolase
MVHVPASNSVFTGRDSFLMCRPDYFRVSYDINPWMTGQTDKTHLGTATAQWTALRTALNKVADVHIMEGAEPVPDLVFTANAALISGDKAILSRFRHSQRQAEEPLNEKWLSDYGFEVLRLPGQIEFEGAGDALFDRGAPRLWLGYGHRSDQRCAPLLQRWLPHEVVPLELADPRFYHLDTCFCPLPGGVLMYFPPAFSAQAQAAIADRIAPELRIVVSEADALGFCCNTVSSGDQVFMNAAGPELIAALAEHHLQANIIALDQFMRAGGAAKCLTLKLTEPLPVTIGSPIRQTSIV